MSIGKSGRIVIEIDPQVKQELYQELTKDGKSLKQWFLNNVDDFLTDRDQLVMSFDEPNKEQGVVR